MVQAASGEWLRRTQPTRHVRRETRWALQEEHGDRPPHTRLPIIGGLKADIGLVRVGTNQGWRRTLLGHTRVAVRLSSHVQGPVSSISPTFWTPYVEIHRSVYSHRGLRHAHTCRQPDEKQW